ncbi:MAG TPA: EAL domain-containing protein [Burkholderiales bacterium]|nr:EAL domain-containing protein [Burkholderiales bacterium]
MATPALQAPGEEEFLERMGRELTPWADPVQRLRQALARDELILFAQPIESLQEPGTYPMAEALVRLREEEAALLPPGEFLPVFEHCRMMPEFDQWVLRHVALAISRGSIVRRFGVNVSTQTLGEAGFTTEAAAVLARAEVDPSSIVFEIDEADFLAYPDAAERFAIAAKAIGCKLLLDGFGRRSVSFNALKTLGVEYLKVDGVIVRKLAVSEVARSKLSAIARVGEVVGVTVIAECVEDRDTVSRLLNAGVRYAQGFGIRPPEPIDKFMR